jgi:N-acetylmuramoyl-L-alanine amidase
MRVTVVMALVVLCSGAAVTPAAAACDAAQFPVAIDIGHTAESPGAMSARGIPEFAFNMALGRDAVAALRQAGFPASPVVVAGTGSQQLSRRVAAAKSLRPALVISIHHDSVQERYLEDWQFAGQPRRFSDRFSGFSIFVSDANSEFAQSLSFATELGRALTSAGLTFSTHHAENIPGENRKVLDPANGVFAFRNLKVLKDAQAPAVLLEAGLIVNRAEEMELASPARRQTVAAAIVEAVTAMCTRRGTKLVLQ